MSVTETLTTDDEATLDAMLGRSNSVNIVDLLATVIDARAAALRAVNLYDPTAKVWEAQAEILRATQQQLAAVLNG